MEADLPNNVEDAFVYRFQKRGRSVGRSVGWVGLAWLGSSSRREGWAAGAVGGGHVLGDGGEGE